MHLVPKDLPFLISFSDQDVSFMGFSPLWSRPDWMGCQVMAVPPPAVRPSVKHDAQQRSEDDISHIIVNIIKANKTLTTKIQQIAASNVIEAWAEDIVLTPSIEKLPHTIVFATIYSSKQLLIDKIFIKTIDK